jgi:hypothetical protein
MIAPLVHSQRTDVDKPSQRTAGFDGVQKVLEPADVDRPVFVNRSPVANLGGAMHDQSDPGDSPGERGRVGQFPLDLFHPPLVEEFRIAAGPHEPPRAQPQLPGALGHMAADQSRRPCDQKQVIRLGNGTLP